MLLFQEQARNTGVEQRKSSVTEYTRLQTSVYWQEAQLSLANRAMHLCKNAMVSMIP